MAEPQSKLSVGDWVEVRGKDEILLTLDSDGQLEGMPFMPEMLEYAREAIIPRAPATCCGLRTSRT